ncbi:ArsR/SmtB family transcription factor, partial [Thermococcus sp.]
MKDVIIITEPERVMILSENTRFRILELLRERPMTINELTEILDRDRATIYRHIKTLEKAGFVEEIGQEGNERIYARTARIFLIKADPDA